MFAFNLDFGRITRMITEESSDSLGRQVTVCGGGPSNVKNIAEILGVFFYKTFLTKRCFYNVVVFLVGVNNLRIYYKLAKLL